jgi:FtsZ-interacting cell division protein YlmF
LHKGDLLDCLDTASKWLISEVLDETETTVYIHYHNWDSSWDETIDRNSWRLAKLHTYTTNTNLHWSQNGNCRNNNNKIIQSQSTQQQNQKSNQKNKRKLSLQSETEEPGTAASAVCTEAEDVNSQSNFNTSCTTFYYEPRNFSDLCLVKQDNSNREIEFHIHSQLLAVSSKWAEKKLLELKTAKDQQTQQQQQQQQEPIQKKPKTTNIANKAETATATTSLEAKAEESTEDESNINPLINNNNQQSQAQNDNRIEVPTDVTLPQLHAFLDCVYNKDTLSVSNCLLIIPAAFHFDAQPILDRCQQFLSRELEFDAATCKHELPYLNLLLLCEKYKLHQVMQTVKPHVKQNIVSMIQRREFATIWPQLTSEMTKELLFAMLHHFQDPIGKLVKGLMADIDNATQQCKSISNSSLKQDLNNAKKKIEQLNAIVKK